MKKIILSLALVTGLTTLSNAQDATTAAPVKNQQKKDLTPEERAKKAAEWAGKKLGLSAQQKSDWEVAVLKREMANKPFHDKLKGSTTPEERNDLHTQIRANRDAFEATINGFLTAEQKTKFEQIKKQKQEAHRAKMKAEKPKEDVLEGEIEG